ncbi:MAG TPA: hypothetical protein VGA18_07840 [Rhodothermales bacterium]|jgi:hypothetical protein
MIRRGIDPDRSPRRPDTVSIDVVDGEIKIGKGQPFLRIRLTGNQAEELLRALMHFTASRKREWFALTFLQEQPARLRLTTIPTPDDEQLASAVYLSGNPMRISGDEHSCRIEFSGAVGGRLFVDRVQESHRRMHRFFEIRVPSRNRNLIEFLCDAELDGWESAEHQNLAEASAALAAEALPVEDFSDWDV